jgi:hypothetical protein
MRCVYSTPVNFRISYLARWSIHESLNRRGRGRERGAASGPIALPDQSADGLGRPGQAARLEVKGRPMCIGDRSADLDRPALGKSHRSWTRARGRLRS